MASEPVITESTPTTSSTQSSSETEQITSPSTILSTQQDPVSISTLTSTEETPAATTIQFETLEQTSYSETEVPYIDNEEPATEEPSDEVIPNLTLSNEIFITEGTMEPTKSSVITADITELPKVNISTNTETSKITPLTVPFVPVFSTTPEPDKTTSSSLFGDFWNSLWNEIYSDYDLENQSTSTTSAPELVTWMYHSNDSVIALNATTKIPELAVATEGILCIFYPFFTLSYSFSKSDIKSR